MLRFDVDNNRFNFRSVAVVIHSGHVLLHRATYEDFWTLPGGRVEFFETSETTLVRELYEELGVQICVDRHLWYVENFFTYDGMRYHEIANYFLANFINSPDIKTEIDFPGIEKEIDLLFRWMPIARLTEYALMPDFLISGIQHLPEKTEYIKLNELIN